MATTIITADQGFDETYYLQAKATQMGVSVGECLAQLTAAGLSPAEHYSLYGYKEGLSPNAYFDASQYAASKAAEVGGGYTAAQFEIDWYNASGSSNLYLHYYMYGAFETGVSPSSGFDDQKYYAAKAAQMGGGATPADAQAAIQAAGLNAISHYLLYGIKESLSYTPSPVASGKTFVLTTDIDNITGTAGDDTFIGNNATTVQLADQINGGAGTDIFKDYVATGTGVDTATMPQMTSIESLYISGGALTTTKALNYTAAAYSDVTSITLVDQDVMANADVFTITTSATQSLSLANTNVATTGAAKINVKGTSSISLNGVGTSTTNDGALTLDLTGTQSTLSFTTAGAASTVTLANTGAKVTSLTVTGDQALTLTESLAALKSIDASKSSGGVSVDTSGAAVNAALTFTGGTGNDSITLAAGGLGVLTAGSQLDGGAGTDTLVTKEVAALTAAQVAKINAAQNFEVLGFAANGSGVDIATLDSIDSFAVSKAATGTTTFTNANSTSTFAVDVSAGTTAVSITNAVGETSTTVALTNTSAGAKTLGTLTLGGATTVALSSSGKAGSGTTVTTLANTDNSAITLTGSIDFTTTMSGTTVGSKFDASSFTGDLTLTGSAKNDVLIGGSGDDTLTAGGGADSFTGGTGTNAFSVAEGDMTLSTSVYATITDWTVGTNSIDDSTTAISIMPTATAGSLAINAKGLVTGGATTLSQFITEALKENTTAGTSCVWTDGTDSYVFVSDGASATTTDLLFKISGVNSTSGLGITGGDITSIA